MNGKEVGNYSKVFSRWSSFIYYTDGNVVWAEDDIAYIAVPFFGSLKPRFLDFLFKWKKDEYKVMNINQNPLTSSCWTVWKRAAARSR